MNQFLTQYFFPFIITLGIIILFYTMKNLLPSYFSEKGKNLATVDDIEKITSLVEGVKQAFTTETEKLKANLSVLTNVQIGLASEERNAIIDFNKKYFRWLNTLIDTSIGGVDNESNSELDAYSLTISNCYNDFINSETIFNLFVDNKNITAIAIKLKLGTLENLGGITNQFILSLKHINIKLIEFKKGALTNDSINQHRDLLNERKDAYTNFTDKIFAGFPAVAKTSNEFQKACREHLYKLLSGDNK